MTKRRWHDFPLGWPERAGEPTLSFNGWKVTDSPSGRRAYGDPGRAEIRILDFRLVRMRVVLRFAPAGIERVAANEST